MGEVIELSSKIVRQSLADKKAASDNNLANAVNILQFPQKEAQLISQAVIEYAKRFSW